MAYSVVWSSNVIDDVDSIATYIAKNLDAYAASVVSKILNSTRKLEEFPLSGRIVPEFGQESIREQIACGYRIIYRIQGEIVTIAAILLSQ